MSSTANATRRIPKGVRRRVPVATPSRRGVKLHQFEPSMAFRSLQHRDVHADALEPHHTVHPTALNRPLTQHLESELDEERRRGREVVDHDAHVLQVLNRHALDASNTATQPWALQSSDLLNRPQTPRVCSP